MSYVGPYQPGGAANSGSGQPNSADDAPVSRGSEATSTAAQDPTVRPAPQKAPKDSAATTSGDGLTNGKGAPALMAPPMSISADDLLALLRSIQTKSSDVQMSTAKLGLENAKVKIEQNTANQIRKLQEWTEKAQEAESKGRLGKIFGWIGKVVAVVAALGAVAVAGVSAIASGGAATPLLLFASMALVSATISLADQISQECGGPPISLGNLVTSACSKLLQTFGVDQEVADRIGKVMAGAVAIAMPVMLLVEPQLIGTMAAGVCELAGADPNTAAIVSMVVGMATAVTVGILAAVASCGASAASSATKVVSGLINSGAQITLGVTGIATGATGIAVAKTTAEADGVLASKKDLEAAMARLQKLMEEGREDLKKIIQEIEDGIRAVSQIINGSVESMAQITANMGRRVTV